MNKFARTAVIALIALSPLSPAAFASERNHDGDRHHDARPGHGGGHGYYDNYRHHYYRHHHRHHDHHYSRHHYRHGWDRHHGYDRDVHYGNGGGYQVVLPAPPLPLILPPHLVLKHSR